MKHAFPFVRRDEDGMAPVVRTHVEEVTVSRVDRLTVQDVRSLNISRFYVGTDVRGSGTSRYEFELYVGRENIFLASKLRNAPKEGDFPEGQVYIRTSQQELVVGERFTVDQADPFLGTTDFTVTYIEIPYKGE